MRISDWSSDVCSSDLHLLQPSMERRRAARQAVPPAAMTKGRQRRERVGDSRNLHSLTLAIAGAPSTMAPWEREGQRPVGERMPRVISVAGAEEIFYPRWLRLYDYWDDKRGAKRMPCRKDIDQVGVEGLPGVINQVDLLENQSDDQ